MPLDVPIVGLATVKEFGAILAQGFDRNKIVLSVGLHFELRGEARKLNLDEAVLSAIPDVPAVANEEVGRLVGDGFVLSKVGLDSEFEMGHENEGVFVDKFFGC